MIITESELYKYIVCEFDHYDIPLTGLIKVDEVYKYFDLCDPTDYPNPEYEIHDINWNDKCQEYLDDYKIAYKHWFYENQEIANSYKGWDLSWFSNKWNHKNPIQENII